jgi:hypothetical protein
MVFFKEIKRAGLVINHKTGSAGNLARFSVENRFGKYLILANNGMIVGVSKTPTFYRKPVINRLLGYNF